LSIKSKGKTVKINIDNTTAVACINNFGSTHSEVCNLETREIWNFASENNIWLIAAHLPGKLNVVADKESRKIRDETEWMLNEKLFHKLIKAYFKPTIDLFASRLNFQINRYVSWIPDPHAIAIDAFTVCWSSELCYAFPPFSIVHQVTQNIWKDKAEGLIIVPYLADTMLVPSSDEIMCSTAHKNKNEQIIVDTETQTGRDTPSLPEIDTFGMRESLEEQKLSVRTIQIIMNSCRKSTRRYEILHTLSNS